MGPGELFERIILFGHDRASVFTQVEFEFSLGGHIQFFVDNDVPVTIQDEQLDSFRILDRHTVGEVEEAYTIGLLYTRIIFIDLDFVFILFERSLE